MGNRVRARAGAGADQDVQAKIFERGVEHLFHIGQQAVNFVDEEDLPCADVAQDAGEIQFFLQHGSGSLTEWALRSSSAMMQASVVLPRPGGP